MTPADRTRPPGAPAGPVGRRTGMHAQHPQYRPRPRRNPGPVIAAVAVSVTALIVVALVVVLIAYSRSPEAAGYDSATIRACELVRDSRGGLDGKGAATIRAAADSGETPLRDAADRYLGEAEPNALDMRESVLRIARWCVENGLNKS